MVDLPELRVKTSRPSIGDIPQMVGLRLQGPNAARRKKAARIGCLDKQMAMMPSEMRDPQGDVIRPIAAGLSEFPGYGAGSALAIGWAAARQPSVPSGYQTTLL
jgi:hypothetical protein